MSIQWGKQKTGDFNQANNLHGIFPTFGSWSQAEMTQKQESEFGVQGVKLDRS